VSDWLIHLAVKMKILGGKRGAWYSGQTEPRINPPRLGSFTFTQLKRAPKDSRFRLKLITKQFQTRILRVSALMFAG
jgi:hypothetical protein